VTKDAPNLSFGRSDLEFLNMIEHLVACAIILLNELASSFAVSTSES